jgi:hypothetical protein
MKDGSSLAFLACLPRTGLARGATGLALRRRPHEKKDNHEE